MAKVFLVSFLFASLAYTVFTKPLISETIMNMPNAEEQVVAIPTDALIDALTQQHGIKLEGEGQNRGNLQSLFNLTAALQGAPTNSPALTFIPLITLIFGNQG